MANLRATDFVYVEDPKFAFIEGAVRNPVLRGPQPWGHVL